MTMSVGTVTTVGTALVQPGSHVRVHDDDGERELVIVEPNDADFSVGRVSSESPLGRAMLGHRAGERVVVLAPAGRLPVLIVAISDAAP
jgi:transcription elongation GreA/GreB family factor